MTEKVTNLIQILPGKIVLEKRKQKKQKQKQTNGTNWSFDEIFFWINNVIHCERILLKRWPTLFRYFRVKLLKKTETNKRNELLNIWWNFLPVKECCFVQKQRTSKKFGPIINPMGLSNSWAWVAH